MSERDCAVDVVEVFRRRARHAEAEAQRASDDIAREVFILVAAAWREIALDAARLQRAHAAAAAKVGRAR